MVDNERNIQFSLTNSFIPDSLSDAEAAQKVDEFLDELDAASIQSDRSIENGVWLLEAAVNYSKAHRELLDILDTKQFTYELAQDILQNDKFTDNELYDIYQDLVAICTNEDDVLLNSDMEIGLIDLTLNQDKIEISIVRIANRTYSSTDRWLCHPAVRYPFESDYNPFTGNYHKCCTCPNEYYDEMGVNHILSKIVSASVRGFGCPTEDFLHPCLFEEHFVVSVGWDNVNESSSASGTYSGTYPYLMPHTPVSNWNKSFICHDGVKIRWIAENRITNWVTDDCQSQHPNSYPLFFEAWVPPMTSSYGTVIQKGQYAYGRCIWSGRPWDGGFATL